MKDSAYECVILTTRRKKLSSFEMYASSFGPSKNEPSFSERCLVVQQAEVSINNKIPLGGKKDAYLWSENSLALQNTTK